MDEPHGQSIFNANKIISTSKSNLLPNGDEAEQSGIVFISIAKVAIFLKKCKDFA